MGRVARSKATITRQIRWYIGALMGDTDYRRYVAYRQRTHAGEPVLTEAEYWRMRYAEADNNPGARCC